MDIVLSATAMLVAANALHLGWSEQVTHFAALLYPKWTRLEEPSPGNTGPDAKCLALAGTEVPFRPLIES